MSTTLPSSPNAADDTGALRAALRAFVEANMHGAGQAPLHDGDNIFKLGFVSSLFAMRLLTFIEKTARIEVGDGDIALANFSSIDAMLGLVARCRQA